MDNPTPPPIDQQTIWNGKGGHAWVDAQALIDGVLQPLLERLAEEVAAGDGKDVLDVGCGTGSTTLAIARLPGRERRCLGIDISGPMLAAARRRAEAEGVPAEFVRADAQRHAFAPARFDMIVSRLGVMFFDDPVVAFANLREAAKPGAALRCIAWRGAAENGFMTTAERAAAPFLPNLPPRRPDAPGQFGFADPERVRRILEASGWTSVDLQPIDAVCSLPESALERYFTQFGPLGLVLDEADAATRSRIVDVVRAAFEPFVDGETVRFSAACWMAKAQAPEEG